jgi:glycosyltransferase involved in cell wall biosynthesis
MKVLIFANKMPDLCGAFLHDVDLGLELQRRGHQVVFMIITVPKEGYYGDTYRGFRFMHYTVGTNYLDTSEVWICPHSPILPNVRKINSRGYNRPIIATCHFDGNYTSITGRYNSNWNEMLFFINRIMEPNYRKNITPWPPTIQTDTIRPIMHEDAITIREAFRGDCITIVNANENKGVRQFIEMAKAMPHRKFLGVIPYYGEKVLPPSPNNVEWVPFQDDIRVILKRTRILVLPSYYESFGRIAVEAMVNGIPVMYSKPNPNSVYPGGSTEGVADWIGDAGIPCDRETTSEWVAEIAKLDDEETYVERSQKVRDHIRSMNLFTEASRIATLVENFARKNPVVIRSSTSILPPALSTPTQQSAPLAPRVTEKTRVGFVNGRLKIRR